jgi:hypothetical protein
LEKLGFPIGQELAIDFILASLPPSYGNFILNYHMHGAEKGLNELCGMLKIAEADIKKGAGSSHVMAVQNKPKFKKTGNSWKKKKGKAKDEISKPNPPAPKCFHCKGKGHWKRNCKLYLASLKKDGGSKGTPAAHTLVVYVTDIFLSTLILILGHLILDRLLIFAIRCKE